MNRPTAKSIDKVALHGFNEITGNWTALPSNELGPVKMAYHTGGTTIIYLGLAALGTADNTAEWRLLRMDLSSILLDLQWADGNKNFDNDWSDRENKSYSN